jgi:phosphoserine aminotransferase
MRPDFAQKLHSVLFKIVRFSKRVPNPAGYCELRQNTQLFQPLHLSFFLQITALIIFCRRSTFSTGALLKWFNNYRKYFTFAAGYQSSAANGDEPLHMNKKVNFTPGPSQLYFTVEGHARAAFRDGIPSLSHRSKGFESIYQSTADGLRALLNLPPDYHIYFTGSATEVWERIIQNLVEETSHHFVNGSFSKRFFEIAQQLNRNATKTEVPFGEGFLTAIVPGQPEVIAVTHNETSTGVSMPLQAIHGLRSQHPDALIVVDAVSSLPYPELDYSKIDSVFFSVQKAFGLPAGLGVWIVNDRCVARAEHILSQGKSIGTYHNIPSLQVHARKNQTPETPNVLGIYLLDKVIQDFLRRGIHAIRRETEYKAAILYQLLEGHSLLKPFVKEKLLQSKTVIVADCGEHTLRTTELLNKNGMAPGEGYGSFKKSQLRFANFPTHSKEQFELLVDTLDRFS